MKTKLLLAYTAILVIAMITVPVIAAPPDSVPPVTIANPVNEILTIVKDIQTNLGIILTNVGTILTRLTSLQTDVTTIKTTTDTIKTTTNTINDKLATPQEPVMYEYYTGPLSSDGYPIEIIPTIINWGDTPANFEIYIYYLSDTLGWGEVLHQTITLPPHNQYYVSNIDTGPQYHYVKITTNSKYLTPTVAFYHRIFINSNNPPEYELVLVDKYLPEDFKKVEIYS